MAIIKIFGDRLGDKYIWEIEAAGKAAKGIADTEAAAKRDMLAEIKRIVDSVPFETVAFEPKTSDYCKVCGESPESASHGPFANAHEYVFDPKPVSRSARRQTAGCLCSAERHQSCQRRRHWCMVSDCLCSACEQRAAPTGGLDG